MFTTQALNEYQTSTTAEHCQRLCKRMHQNGQMASVDTADQFKKLKDRLRMVSTMLNQNDIFVWLPLQRENGIWLNSLTVIHKGKDIVNRLEPWDASRWKQSRLCNVWSSDGGL